MINQPVLITQSSFQAAWAEAVAALSANQWDLRNLVVHIKDPSLFSREVHQLVRDFSKRHSLLPPIHVAYTIFPHRLYRRIGTAQELFHQFNKPQGLYERLHRLHPTEWGTYFRRMTHYESGEGAVNQLRNIIEAINARRSVWKSAYSILIQHPGRESIRNRAGPCLNYATLQMEPGNPQPLLGMLCAYRSHDFRERAYGNYWGLCNLLSFLCRETDSSPGPVTCISSRAYVPGLRRSLENLASSVQAANDYSLQSA
jgi:hypothetical protein